MAIANLLVLIDDIAVVLDDVAVITKVAIKKTAGVLGDDLALNASQVSGMASSRELPVVWAVAKGSLINKAILVPLALIIAALAPFLILPLLAVGGLYLCFEGMEKIWHSFHQDNKDESPQNSSESSLNIQDDIDKAAFEREKIRGAVRTDFILSAEIIVITLGTVGEAVFLTQVIVLIGISILMTVGVYGLVAAIVKLDDLGIWCLQTSKKYLQIIGHGLLWFAPWMMRGLAFAGTFAMFLVGGGIVLHALPFGHQLILTATDFAQGFMPLWLAEAAFNLISGLIAGVLVLLVVHPVIYWWGKARP